ncbi:MAG TPA: TerC family protein [Polyangiaceae bacterium]|nr:TerC family protein [Polyangiaceae bacterium]
MQLIAWGGFLLLIAFFLALDLGVFHKDDEVVTGKSALKWTAVWFVVAMLFNVFVYYAYEHRLLGLGDGQTSGRDASINFFTGYIVEQSLSLDNIFVMALIFRFFKVPLHYQHRVLFWGILGAIVLRVSMILLGAALIKSFSFTIYIFGAILVFTSIKMALSKGDDDFDPNDSFIVKTARKMMPISKDLEGHNFFTVIDGKRAMTPLLLVLLVVEGTDVVFAVDSIPAIFGVTTDAFIVFTSNIFAIMGLRSLYFALASLLRQFAYLKYSLIVVLLFVGVKMLVSKWWHPSSVLSLGIIAGFLVAGVLVSLIMKKEDDEDDPTSLAPGAEAKQTDDASKTAASADAAGDVEES